MSISKQANDLMREMQQPAKGGDPNKKPKPGRNTIKYNEFLICARKCREKHAQALVEHADPFVAQSIYIYIYMYVYQLNFPAARFRFGPLRTVRCEGQGAWYFLRVLC